MDKTKIEWVDASWNPLRGCSRVSEGCRNCYAEGIASRFAGPGQPYEGVVRIGDDGKASGWNGNVRLHPEVLAQPLRWKKPRRIFVNSMSDTFHERVTDEWIGAIFGVAALCPQHTFMMLTKRPERMRDFVRSMTSLTYDPARSCMDALASFDVPVPRDAPSGTWPLPNVWLGVSVENQRAADERVPLLLDTPSARHFLSVEPLLEKVDLDLGFLAATTAATPWVIVGGESGRDARPCRIGWIRDVVEQCRRREIPCFTKQIGSAAGLVDAKGGDPQEWPPDLRLRQIPS